MTDNICEIETAAVALRTRYSGDPGILLTDFSCADLHGVRAGRRPANLTAFSSLCSQ